MPRVEPQQTPRTGANTASRADAQQTERITALENAPPAHAHTQEEIAGLVDVIADLNTRIEALENPKA